MSAKTLKGSPFKNLLHTFEARSHKVRFSIIISEMKVAPNHMHISIMSIQISSIKLIDFQMSYPMFVGAPNKHTSGAFCDFQLH
jgi:hypothetical protein